MHASLYVEAYGGAVMLSLHKLHLQCVPCDFSMLISWKHET